MLHPSKILERSLKTSDKLLDFAGVVWEYFDMGHAESVPVCDLASSKESYYMQMHTVTKGSGTTMKMRAVFDASAKSTSGT